MRFFKKKKEEPFVVRYEPKKDITAYELAEILKFIFAHKSKQHAIDSFDRMPKSCSRHFSIEEKGYIGKPGDVLVRHF